MGDFDAAEDLVVEGSGASLGHAEAHRRRLARRAACLCLVAGNRAAGARVARRTAFGLRLLAPPLQLVFGAEAVVGVAGSHQLLRRLPVELQAPGLVDRSFVPVEPQPAHARQDALDHGVGGALEVGVLDAQDEDALMVAREQPVEERGARAAHVQVAGGRGRKTHADWIVGSHERKANSDTTGAEKRASRKVGAATARSAL